MPTHQLLAKGLLLKTLPMWRFNAKQPGAARHTKASKFGGIFLRAFDDAKNGRLMNCGRSFLCFHQELNRSLPADPICKLVELLDTQGWGSVQLVLFGDFLECLFGSFNTLSGWTMSLDVLLPNVAGLCSQLTHPCCRIDGLEKVSVWNMAILNIPIAYQGDVTSCDHFMFQQITGFVLFYSFGQNAEGLNHLTFRWSPWQTLYP